MDARIRVRPQPQELQRHQGRGRHRVLRNGRDEPHGVPGPGASSLLRQEARRRSCPPGASGAERHLGASPCVRRHVPGARAAMVWDVHFTAAGSSSGTYVRALARDLGSASDAAPTCWSCGGDRGGPAGTKRTPSRSMPDPPAPPPTPHRRPAPATPPRTPPRSTRPAWATGWGPPRPTALRRRTPRRR